MNTVSNIVFKFSDRSEHIISFQTIKEKCKTSSGNGKFIEFIGWNCDLDNIDDSNTGVVEVERSSIIFAYIVDYLFGYDLPLEYFSKTDLIYLHQDSVYYGLGDLKKKVEKYLSVNEDQPEVDYQSLQYWIKFGFNILKSVCPEHKDMVESAKSLIDNEKFVKLVNKTFCQKKKYEFKNGSFISDLLNLLSEILITLGTDILTKEMLSGMGLKNTTQTKTKETKIDSNPFESLFKMFNTPQTNNKSDNKSEDPIMNIFASFCGNPNQTTSNTDSSLDFTQLLNSMCGLFENPYTSSSISNVFDNLVGKSPEYIDNVLKKPIEDFKTREPFIQDYIIKEVMKSLEGKPQELRDHISKAFEKVRKPGYTPSSEQFPWVQTTTQPTPTQPTPTQPTPTQPTSTQPTPTQPTPTQPNNDFDLSDFTNTIEMMFGKPSSSKLETNSKQSVTNSRTNSEPCDEFTNLFNALFGSSPQFKPNEVNVPKAPEKSSIDLKIEELEKEQKDKTHDLIRLTNLKMDYTRNGLKYNPEVLKSLENVTKRMIDIEDELCKLKGKVPPSDRYDLPPEYSSNPNSHSKLKKEDKEDKEEDDKSFEVVENVEDDVKSLSSNSSLSSSENEEDQFSEESRYNKVVKIGNRVRKLKADKADPKEVKEAVNDLLNAKSDYMLYTGKEFRS